MTAYVKNIAAMLIFGSVGIFVRAIPLTSSEIVASRTILGSIFLCVILFLRKKKPDWKKVKESLGMVAVTGIVMGLNWLFLFEAYRYTLVSVATLLYYFAPVFVLFLSPFLLGENLTRPKLMGIVAAVVGMALVNGIQIQGAGSGKGVLYGILSAVFYAGVILLNKLTPDVPVVEKTLVQLLTAGAVMGVYAVFTHKGDFHMPQGWGLLMLLIVGIVHTGIAYLLYISSISELPGQTVALCSYIDPLSALLFSAVFLQEHLTALQMGGAALILGGSAFGELYQKKEKL